MLFQVTNKKIEQWTEIKSVKKLLEALKEKEDYLVQAAVKGLGKVQDKTAVPYLVETLDKTENEEIKLEIVKALGKIGGGKSETVLKGFLKHSNQRFRIAAAEGLENLNWQPTPDEIGIKYYEIKVNDMEKKEKQTASAMRKLLDLEYKKIGSILMSALKDRDPDVRLFAVEHLKDSEMLKHYAENDDNERIRTTAKKKLKHFTKGKVKKEKSEEKKPSPKHDFTFNEFAHALEVFLGEPEELILNSEDDKGWEIIRKDSRLADKEIIQFWRFEDVKTLIDKYRKVVKKAEV